MTLARLVVAAVLLGSLPASAQVTKKSNQFPRGSAFFAEDWRTAATPSEPWRLIPKQSTAANSESKPLDRLRIDQSGFGQPDGNRIPSSMGAPFSNLHSCGQLPDATCQMGRNYFMSLLPNGQLASIEFPSNEPETDTTCFAIRSYVVARDSKDSDSTHPAGYSTCRPSDRYKVKGAEIRLESGDH
jgi:hypothetical protein